jgi:hypothetical protein
MLNIIYQSIKLKTQKVNKYKRMTDKKLSNCANYARMFHAKTREEFENIHARYYSPLFITLMMKDQSSKDLYNSDNQVRICIPSDMKASKSHKKELSKYKHVVRMNNILTEMRNVKFTLHLKPLDWKEVFYKLCAMYEYDLPQTKCDIGWKSFMFYTRDLSTQFTLNWMVNTGLCTAKIVASYLLRCVDVPCITKCLVIIDSIVHSDIDSCTKQRETCLYNLKFITKYHSKTSNWSNWKTLFNELCESYENDTVTFDEFIKWQHIVLKTLKLEPNVALDWMNETGRFTQSMKEDYHQAIDNVNSCDLIAERTDSVDVNPIYDYYLSGYDTDDSDYTCIDSKSDYTCIDSKYDNTCISLKPQEPEKVDDCMLETNDQSGFYDVGFMQRIIYHSLTGNTKASWILVNRYIEESCYSLKEFVLKLISSGWCTFDLLAKLKYDLSNVDWKYFEQGLNNLDKLENKYQAHNFVVNRTFYFLATDPEDANYFVNNVDDDKNDTKSGPMRHYDHDLVGITVIKPSIINKPEENDVKQSPKPIEHIGFFTTTSCERYVYNSLKTNSWTGVVKYINLSKKSPLIFYKWTIENGYLTKFLHLKFINTFNSCNVNMPVQMYKTGLMNLKPENTESNYFYKLHINSQTTHCSKSVEYIYKNGGFGSWFLLITTCNRDDTFVNLVFGGNPIHIITAFRSMIESGLCTDTIYHGFKNKFGTNLNPRQYEAQYWYQTGQTNLDKLKKCVNARFKNYSAMTKFYNSKIEKKF